MASAKNRLGRGLDALLGGPEPAAEAASPAADAVLSLRLTDIDPNRDQPRRLFDEQALNELAESIESVGVIQPIIVRRTGSRYQIISGERRWRAARIAGLTEIPAIVREYDDAARLEVALIENLQRDDLNPVEEAQGVRQLMDQCGYTQEAAAQRLGRSRPAIANLLRLLTLPEKVLALVEAGQLSAGHARALAALAAPDAQLRLAHLAIAQGWSVRQLERICQQTLQGAEMPEPAPKPAPPREFDHLSRMARSLFGTKAELEGTLSRGKLILHYYSPDDLQRIWDVIEQARQENGDV